MPSCSWMCFIKRKVNKGSPICSNVHDPVSRSRSKRLLTGVPGSYPSKVTSSPTGACCFLWSFIGLPPQCPQLGTLQFSLVTQSCLTLCDPLNCSMPGLPVHHQLPEFTQTHVHQVGDAIQPSHPLLSPSPPAPNPSQDQGLFQ